MISTREPHDDRAFARALHECAEAGTPAYILGGGTLQGIGDAALPESVAISTRALSEIIAYDPRDLTIGVAGGCNLARLSTTLANEGQFVPLDAPQPSRATVGGTLAAGWLGPRRASYGRSRDLVIGTTAALVDGTLARAGGMVVKNVTGYDLSKVYIGSLGTLGAIVRANFKTLPLPAAFRVAIAPLPENSRERAIEHLATLEVEPTCELVVRGFRDALPFAQGVDGTLFVVFEGSAALVERATRALRSALGAAGVAETKIVDVGARDAFARMLDAYIAPIEGRSITLRSLGLPSASVELDAAIRKALESHAVLVDSIIDGRCGDVISRLFVDGAIESAELRATLAAAVSAARSASPGATVLARAVPNDGIASWGTRPIALEAMHELKRRFDPSSILARGRFVGGI